MLAIYRIEIFFIEIGKNAIEKLLIFFSYLFVVSTLLNELNVSIIISLRVLIERKTHSTYRK